MNSLIGPGASQTTRSTQQITSLRKPFARSQTALLEAVECLPDAWQPTVLADGLDSNALIVGLQALACAAAIGEEQSLDVE